MVVPEDIQPGIYQGITNAAYHSGPGISSSVLKTMDKSPAHCYAKHFDPNRGPEERSPALIFGDAAHRYMLEIEDFESEFLVLDEGVTRQQKAAREIIDAEDRTVLTFNEFQQISDMREALYAHPMAAAAFTGGVVEASGYWVDAATGHLCKYRPDYRTDHYIADYKTTVDCSPVGFARDAARFGYHQSAAWYLDGDRVLTGSGHDRFIFVVQEKEPPYLVEVYSICSRSLTVGRKKNRIAMDRIAQCKERGSWPGLTHEGVQAISVPFWEMRSHLDEDELYG